MRAHPGGASDRPRAPTRRPLCASWSGPRRARRRAWSRPGHPDAARPTPRCRTRSTPFPRARFRCWCSCPACGALKRLGERGGETFPDGQSRTERRAGARTWRRETADWRPGADRFAGTPAPTLRPDRCHAGAPRRRPSRRCRPATAPGCGAARALRRYRGTPIPSRRETQLPVPSQKRPRARARRARVQAAGVRRGLHRSASVVGREPVQSGFSPYRRRGQGVENKTESARRGLGWRSRRSCRFARPQPKNAMANTISIYINLVRGSDLSRSRLGIDEKCMKREPTGR